MLLCSHCIILVSKSSPSAPLVSYSLTSFNKLLLFLTDHKDFLSIHTVHKALNWLLQVHSAIIFFIKVHTQLFSLLTDSQKVPLGTLSFSSSANCSQFSHHTSFCSYFTQRSFPCSPPPAAPLLHRRSKLVQDFYRAAVQVAQGPSRHPSPKLQGLPAGNTKNEI